MKKPSWLLFALLVVTPLFAATARLEPGEVVCETCYPQAGDFNGDGLDDLMERTNIYFNRGGRFDVAVSASGLRKGDYLMGVADFNRDGFDDVIMLTPGTSGGPGQPGTPGGPSKLYLNNGSGGFTQAKPLPAGSVDHMADVNADGFPDLLIITPTDFTLAVNNGDATFSPVQTRAWPDGKESGTHGATVVGDFNSDGRTDVFFSRNRYVYFYFANEDGTLAAPVKRYSYANLTSSRVADVNGDGHDDIVSLGYVYLGDARIMVLFGDGTGRFPGFAHAYGEQINGDSTQFAVADFFMGGGLEIAVGLRAGAVAVLGANGDRLNEITRIATATNAKVIPAELRADGTTDIVLYSQARAARQTTQLLFTAGGAEAPAATITASRGRSRAVRAGTNATPDGRFEVEVTGPCSASLSGVWNLRREGLFMNVDPIPGAATVEAATIDEEVNLRVYVTEGSRYLEGSVTQKGNKLTGILTESNPPCGGAWAPHFVEGTKR